MRMFSAEAATLDCNNGTILGRDVVPEVCRIRAISSAVGAVSGALPSASVDRVNVPAGSVGVSSITVMSKRLAAARAGPL